MKRPSKEKAEPAPEALDRAAAVARARQSFFPHRFADEVALNDSIMGVFHTHIARTYVPPAPIMPQNARVASIGSCFAEEISKSLRAQGLDVGYIFMSERWNSAFALAKFLDNALFGTDFPPGFVAGAGTVGLPAETIAQFHAADMFILTFGLSLCWFEKATDRLVLEPGESHSITGLKRAMSEFEMRQTSLKDNEREIRRCIALIRKARPKAKIVLTLSPVPLQAALTDVSPIPANIISKSTLRVALANVTARGLSDVYYWPSYDFVDWFGAHIDAAFGGPDGDMRHVKTDLVGVIAQFFKHYYFQP
jgi:hypothetical protein